MIDTSNALDFSHGFPPSLSSATPIHWPSNCSVSCPRPGSSRCSNPGERGDGHHGLGRLDVFIAGNDAQHDKLRRHLLRLGWTDVFDLGDLTAARVWRCTFAGWDLRRSGGRSSTSNSPLNHQPAPPTTRIIRSASLQTPPRPAPRLRSPVIDCSSIGGWYCGEECANNAAMLITAATPTPLIPPLSGPAPATRLRQGRCSASHDRHQKRSAGRTCDLLQRAKTALPCE